MDARLKAGHDSEQGTKLWTYTSRYRGPRLSTFFLFLGAAATISSRPGMTVFSRIPPADSPIDDLRRQIDEIDNALHDLLMRRTEVAVEIGAVKGNDGGEGAAGTPGAGG